MTEAAYFFWNMLYLIFVFSPTVWLYLGTKGKVPTYKTVILWVVGLGQAALITIPLYLVSVTQLK